MVVHGNIYQPIFKLLLIARTIINHPKIVKVTISDIKERIVPEIIRTPLFFFLRREEPLTNPGTASPPPKKTIKMLSFAFLDRK